MAKRPRSKNALPPGTSRKVVESVKAYDRSIMEQTWLRGAVEYKHAVEQAAMIAAAQVPPGVADGNEGGPPIIPPPPVIPPPPPPIIPPPPVPPPIGPPPPPPPGYIPPPIIPPPPPPPPPPGFGGSVSVPPPPPPPSPYAVEHQYHQDKFRLTPYYDVANQKWMCEFNWATATADRAYNGSWGLTQFSEDSNQERANGLAAYANYDWRAEWLDPKLHFLLTYFYNSNVSPGLKDGGTLEAFNIFSPHGPGWPGGTTSVLEMMTALFGPAGHHGVMPRLSGLLPCNDDLGLYPQWDITHGCLGARQGGPQGTRDQGVKQLRPPGQRLNHPHQVAGRGWNNIYAECQTPEWNVYDRRVWDQGWGYPANANGGWTGPFPIQSVHEGHCDPNDPNCGFIDDSDNYWATCQLNMFGGGGRGYYGAGWAGEHHGIWWGFAPYGSQNTVGVWQSKLSTTVSAQCALGADRRTSPCNDWNGLVCQLPTKDIPGYPGLPDFPDFEITPFQGMTKAQVESDPAQRVIFWKWFFDSLGNRTGPFSRYTAHGTYWWATGAFLFPTHAYNLTWARDDLGSQATHHWVPDYGNWEDLTVNPAYANLPAFAWDITVGT